MQSARGERPSKNEEVVSSGEQGSADSSDDEIVALCQSQLPYNTTGYEILVRRYEPQVYGSCLRYLGDPSDAEDACQDIFLRVFHNIKKFEGRSSFKTWLFRIIANVCTTRLSKTRADIAKKRAYSSEVAAIDAHSSGSDINASFGEGTVAAAFEKLSKPDKAILSLRYVLDMTVPEVAETLKLKLSATKMRLHRAENRLRELCERTASTEDLLQ